MNIYVGNLPYQLMDEDLITLFAAYGEINRAKIIKDKFSGRSKGFGFVEMLSDKEALEAIAALNGFEIDGRALTVNEAKEDKHN